MKAQPQLGDYKDPESDLLICGKCGKPRECLIQLPNNQQVVISCMCDCESMKWERQLAEEKAARTECLRAKYIKAPALMDMRFETSEDSDILQQALSYVENLPNIKPRKNGLVIVGPPGTGKTHAAACIANKSVDMGIPAGITSISDLLHLPIDERDETIQRYTELPLLVIDDLGTERNTSYGYEIMCSVINRRITTRKPMVVTTNMSLKYIRTPGSMEYTRIYHRVLDVCQPILVNGKNYRNI